MKGLRRKGYIWHSILRTIVVTVVCGLGIYFLRGYGIKVHPFLLLLFLSYILTVPYLIVRKDTPIMPAFQTVLDFLIITLLIHYTGGYRSDLVFLYFLPIVAASYFFLLKGGIVAASLSLFSYSFLLLLERTGRVKPFVFAGVGETVPNEILLLKILLFGVFFFVVALLSSLTASYVRRGSEELMEARELLKQMKLDTLAMLESVPSGIVAVDEEGKFIYFNRTARKILGVTNPIGIDDLENIVPEFSRELREILRRNKEGGRREVTVKTANGKKKPIGFNHAYLFGEKGNRRGAIMVFQDLTEIKELEWELRRKERLAAIGEFSAHLAHEIRNPLTAVRGSIELMKDTRLGTEESRRLMDLVLKESDRLNRILADFLNFARIGFPDFKEVRLSQLLRRVVSLAEERTRYTDEIEFEKNIKGDEIIAKGDENQLETAFINVINNAIDSINGKGKVRVSIYLPGDTVYMLNGSPIKVKEREVCIEIRDTGEGMDEDVRSRAFEPFFTTKKEGTGLGLSIVQKVISNHNGRIRIDTKKGVGTSVLIFLPIGGIG